jgi:hypothetical protein
MSMTTALRRTGALFVAAVAALALALAVLPAAQARAAEATQIINHQQSWFQDLCLEVDNGGWNAGDPVAVDWCTLGGLHQEWTPITVGNNIVQLKVGHTGMCLDVKDRSAADGAQIVQWPCDSSRFSQQWTKVSKGGVWYALVSRQSGKCLDKGDGRVIQWGCHVGDWQQWRFA